ncbi:MAG: ion transporter, partial [Microscillaceae bacterium]|nr:ion transporter [Microscillaceae bacterium]
MEQYRRLPFWKKIFVNDRYVLLAILLNIVILFLLSFDEFGPNLLFLENIDNALTIFFLVEMLMKVNILGWRGYIQSGWNRLDFVIVLLTTPSILLMLLDVPDFTLLVVFRALRVAKFFRFLKFVPNLEEIMSGLGRALKASVFVLMAFFLYNIIISLFTCYIFKEYSPEYFGNALISCYSIFKMFTLEGWYEIPRNVLPRNGSVQMEFFYQVLFYLHCGYGGHIRALDCQRY